MRGCLTLILAIIGAFSLNSGGSQIAITPTDAPQTQQELLEGQFAEIEGVRKILMVSAEVFDNGRPYVYAEACTDVRVDREIIASAMFDLSLQAYVTAGLDFSAILDDGIQAADYSWDNGIDDWRVTLLSMTADECKTS